MKMKKKIQKFYVLVFPYSFENTTRLIKNARDFQLSFTHRFLKRKIKVRTPFKKAFQVLS